MKKIKTSICVWLALSAVFMTGCYNDEDLWNKISGLENRIEALETWQLPDSTRTDVLLPREGKISQLVSQAVEAISEPSPLNAVVLTYEFQLTEVIGITHTADARLTELAAPTKTPTPPGSSPATATPLVPGQTPTVTRTPTRTATNPSPLPSPTSNAPYPFPTAIWDTPYP